MNKCVLTAVLGLLAGATQSAQAQVFFSRPTRPVPADPRTGHL